MKYKSLIKKLKKFDTEFAEGLSDEEIEKLESKFDFKFPPDLKEFLKLALPISKGFPNWREALDLEMTAKSIIKWLNWPIEGTLFDIKNNCFWYPEWGEKPKNLKQALELASKELAKVPKLVPVYSHRYMLSTKEEGFPVISVHQTDIIYYGNNLEHYLLNEFTRAGRRLNINNEIKRIPFWSEVIDCEWEDYKYQ